jgi:hypothetical protein
MHINPLPPSLSLSTSLDVSRPHMSNTSRPRDMGVKQPSYRSGGKFRSYQIKCTQTFDPKFKMLLNSTSRKISTHICKDSLRLFFNSNMVHLNYLLKYWVYMYSIVTAE